MEKVFNILSFLKGKKTYIVGALMIALGLLQGDSELIMQGFGFIFLRNGVAKMSE
jgi:hypothetical protein